MKNLTAKQIAQVKEIRTWTSTKFHGNTKKVGSILVSDLKSIVAKKVSRELLKIDVFYKKSDFQKIKELLGRAQQTKGTNYFKIMIEGNTNIYLAHPYYQHSDYNKSRVFPKNEKTLKLMELFNALAKK